MCGTCVEANFGSDRKKNVILYVIPVDFNVEELNYDYEETIKVMLLRIDLNGLQPSSIEVLKKVESEVPLRSNFTLRLQFLHESTATRVLRNAWKLKRSSNYGSTYIAPERTPNEQKEWKKLVEKLKKQIQSEPSAKWSIRRGKVIKCGPWPPVSNDSDSE